MSGQPLVIYGRADSVNVRKVLWCCDELGLAYRREDWGRGFASTRSPAFLALNPNGLVPVIDDGGYVLWQSNAILRYLASAYAGEAIYPAQPQVRGRIEQWMDWQATELNDAWRYVFMGRIRQLAAYQDAAMQQDSIRQWNDCMAILDRQLQQTAGYVAGGEFSLADIPLGISVVRWYSTPIERPELPAVAAYREPAGPFRLSRPRRQRRAVNTPPRCAEWQRVSCGHRSARPSVDAVSAPRCRRASDQARPPSSGAIVVCIG